MKAKVFLPLVVIIYCMATVNAQYPAAQPVNISPNSVAMIANELGNISRSVQTMNERLKAVLDKGSPSTSVIAEPRQKIVVGIQALTAAELRVIQFQTAQYDLAQKLNDTRAKLAQTELDLRPRNIDRSVAFEGTTETEELRESRRQRLQGDRLVLQQNLKQFQGDLATNAEKLQEAQLFADKLRRIYLPQMEREMTEQ